MSRFFAAAFLVAAVISLSFFAVFAFHAFSPMHVLVAEFLMSGQGLLPFSPDANSHLQDVYAVLLAARVATALFVLAALASARYLDKVSVRISGFVLLALPVVLAFVPWDVLFTGMHAVLFPQGNWIFPSDSLLIRTFPSAFFRRFALAWAGLLGIAGLSAILCSFRESLWN